MNPRVIIVGLGFHGTRIATALVQQGGNLAGAADPARAGGSLDEYLGLADGDRGGIEADVDTLLMRVEADVAIVTASVDINELRRISLCCLDRGINVLSIHPDAFDPPASWADAIDASGKATGASFLSTGVQDLWWVHMPAMAAAACTALTAVRISHTVDINDLPVGLGEMVGLTRSPEDFAGAREILMQGDSVLGAPLRVLARRLGLTATSEDRSINPVIASEPMRWTSGDRTVDPGRLAGFSEVSGLQTQEGVLLEGTIRTALLEPGSAPSDIVLLEGDPVLRLEHKPFPGARVTDLVPISRIGDIVSAAPGFHTAATMPPPAHRRSLT